MELDIGLGVELDSGYDDVPDAGLGRVDEGERPGERGLGADIREGGGEPRLGVCQGVERGLGDGIVEPDHGYKLR